MRLTKIVASANQRPELITMLKGIVKTAENLGFEFKKHVITDFIYYIGGSNIFGQCKTGAMYICIGLNETYIDNCLKAGRTDLILNTLIHEICHALKGAINHGAQWKYYARIMGEHYGLDIERCGTEEESKFLPSVKKRDYYNYIVRCPKCNAEWYYKTLCGIVKNPSRYNCGKCKVRLISEGV